MSLYVFPVELPDMYDDVIKKITDDIGEDNYATDDEIKY